MLIRLLFTFIVSLLLTALPGRAQERVRNVRLRVIDSSQIEIRYDLIDARPGDSVYVRMESRWRGDLLILPEFIRGDIGKRLTAGSDRRVVWDALANGYPINEDIRATVVVKTIQLVRVNTPTGALIDSVATGGKKPTAPEENAPINTEPAGITRSRKTRYAGPAWALLSAVAPGVGNIFVQRPKPKVGLRPLVTAGCYGLFLYGLAERQKAQDAYAVYEQQKNMTAAEPYYQTANRHHQTYFLATRGAIVVAAADVVLTLLKGLRHSQLQKKAQRPQAIIIRPGVQAGQPTAVVHYSF